MQLKIFGAIAIALMFAAPAAWAEPSVAQVTQAVQAGRLDQAQSMMQEVLVAHPQSAEAQYLEARISARQGNWAAAAAALQKSEQLAPGMPFVKPQVLTAFKKSVQGHMNNPVGKISKESRWGTVLAFFLGLVALIALISMLLRRRQRANMIYRGQPFGGGVNGYGPMNPGGAMGGMPQQGGGLGSSLASGIATGVGVGAGLAAGQALAGSLFGHGNESDNTASDNNNNDLGLTDDSWGNDPLASNDDFGLDDGGDSWG